MKKLCTVLLCLFLATALCAQKRALNFEDMFSCRPPVVPGRVTRRQVGRFRGEDREYRRQHLPDRPVRCRPAGADIDKIDRWQGQQFQSALPENGTADLRLHPRRRSAGLFPGPAAPGRDQGRDRRCRRRRRLRLAQPTARASPLPGTSIPQAQIFRRCPGHGKRGRGLQGHGQAADRPDVPGVGLVARRQAQPRLPPPARHAPNSPT